jgi:hypothetical protein
MANRTNWSKVVQFKDVVCGATFTKDAARWIKVSHRPGGGGLAYQLNDHGVAVPSLKREFFPETVVVCVGAV